MPREDWDQLLLERDARRFFLQVSYFWKSASCEALRKPNHWSQQLLNYGDLEVSLGFPALVACNDVQAMYVCAYISPKKCYVAIITKAPSGYIMGSFPYGVSCIIWVLALRTYPCKTLLNIKTSEQWESRSVWWMTAVVNPTAPNTCTVRQLWEPQQDSLIKKHI